MNIKQAVGINSFNIHKGIRGANFKKNEHHYHNWHEIFIVLSGECRFSVYDTFYSVAAGEAILFQPGMFHCYTSEHGCEYLIIEFTAGYISRFFSANVSDSFLKSFNTVCVSLSDTELAECVRLSETADNESNADMYDSILAIGGILNIFSKVGRKASAKNLHFGRKNSIEKLNHITDYIAENYRDITSVTELSKLCYISKSHMYRIFKQELGISLSSYINSLKIDYARELLLTTNMPIVDISAECGFNSTQYLSKIFKIRFGCTPAEYRKKTVALTDG